MKFIEDYRMFRYIERLVKGSADLVAELALDEPLVDRVCAYLAGCRPMAKAKLDLAFAAWLSSYLDSLKSGDLTRTQDDAVFASLLSIVARINSSSSNGLLRVRSVLLRELVTCGNALLAFGSTTNWGDLFSILNKGKFAEGEGELGSFGVRYEIKALICEYARYSNDTYVVDAARMLTKSITALPDTGMTEASITLLGLKAIRSNTGPVPHFPVLGREIHPLVRYTLGLEALYHNRTRFYDTLRGNVTWVENMKLLLEVVIESAWFLDSAQISKAFYYADEKEERALMYALWCGLPLGRPFTKVIEELVPKDGLSSLGRDLRSIRGLPSY